MNRKIAVVIFYDDNLNVLMQVRGDHSKRGEKYGFWGGGIEEGETPEEALLRELNEELGYIPEEYKHWGRYSFDDKTSGKTFYGEMFLSPITKELLDAQFLEGEGKELVHIDKLIENKNNELGPVASDFLIPIKKDLVKLVNSLRV